LRRTVLKLPSSIVRFLKIFPCTSSLSVSRNGIKISKYFQQASYSKDKDFQSSSSKLLSGTTENCWSPFLTKQWIYCLLLDLLNHNSYFRVQRILTFANYCVRIWAVRTILTVNTCYFSKQLYYMVLIVDMQHVLKENTENFHSHTFHLEVIKFFIYPAECKTRLF
jgi:hypothetical protein